MVEYFPRFVFCFLWKPPFARKGRLLCQGIQCKKKVSGQVWIKFHIISVPVREPHQLSEGREPTSGESPGDDAGTAQRTPPSSGSSAGTSPGGIMTSQLNGSTMTSLRAIFVKPHKASSS